MGGGGCRRLKSLAAPSMLCAMESVTQPSPASGWSVPPLPPAGGRPATNGPAVAALVLGALGLSFATNPALFVLAVPVGLTGVVCGAVGIGRANATGVGRGQSIAGIVTGGLGAVGGVVWVALVGSLVSAFMNLGGTATTPPLSDTFTASGPTCEDADDRRSVEGEVRAGDYILSEVVVCSDFADDFAFTALVRNDGTRSGAVTLELSALTDGAAVGTGSATVTLAPGASASTGFLSFDDHRSDWTDVSARAQT